jgi:hypothetical protein
MTVLFTLGMLVSINYDTKSQERYYVSRFQEPKIGMEFEVNGALYNVTNIEWRMINLYGEKESIPELTLKFLKIN